jgi:hypothetical protein
MAKVFLWGTRYEFHILKRGPGILQRPEQDGFIGGLESSKLTPIRLMSYLSYHRLSQNQSLRTSNLGRPIKSRFATAVKRYF